MTEQEILEKVSDVVLGVLNRGSESPVQPTEANLANWDSLKHMNVILAVENEFDIEFDETELEHSISIPLLVAAVQKHISSAS